MNTLAKTYKGKSNPTDAEMQSFSLQGHCHFAAVIIAGGAILSQQLCGGDVLGLIETLRMDALFYC